MKRLINGLKYCGRGVAVALSSALLVFSPSVYSVSTDLTIDGAFSSSIIGDGNVSSLTLTLDNQTGQSVRDISFLATIDNPTFMGFSDPINVSTTCASGDYSFSATEFSASNYILISGQACTFTFDFIGNVDDGLTVLDVTVSDLVSSAGVGTNPAGPVQLSVEPSYMTASIAVSNNTLSVGSVNTVTVAVGNLPLWFNSLYYLPSGSINFTDGLSLASPVNFSTTCGDLNTNSNTSGANSFVMSSGGYADSTSCEYSFDVVSTTAGKIKLFSTELTNPSGNTQIGKISTSYTSELGFINATFSPSALVPGGTGKIDVSILNTDRTNPASNIIFTDDLDSVLSGLVSTGDLSNVCGAGSSLTGTGLLTFSGGNLAAGASCEFSINVAVPSNATPGNYINTISAVSYELDGSTITPLNALSSFTVNSAPNLTISTNQSGNPTTSVAAGDVISVEYVLTNVDIANAASSATFVHELTGLPYFTSTAPADGFCNGSGTAVFAPTFNSSGSFVDAKTSFSAISLAAGDSCTFTLDYLVPDDFDAGSYLFSVGMIDATVNSNSVQSASPSASSAFTVDAAPQLTMTFNPIAAAPNSSSTIEFAISHGAGSSYSAEAIGFSLDLDAVLSGITIQSLPVEPCGTGSTVSGSSSLVLTAGVLTAGEVCEFSVPVTIPSNASAGTYSFNSSALSASINGNTLSSSLAAADLQVTNVTFSKSFDPTSLRVGSTTTSIKSVYVINNADAVQQVSDLFFTESFSSIYSGVTVSSVTEADACGSGSSAAISGSMLILSAGVIDPLSSCTFEVTLSLPANLPANSYSSATSAITGTVNGNNTTFDPMYAAFTVNEISVLTAVDVSSPTSASSTLMSINFSEDVQNFVVGDISETNATLTNFIEVTASQYTVEVTPDADGIVTLNVAAGVAEDVLDATVTNTEAVAIIFEYQSTPLAPTPSLVIGEPSSLLTSNGDITYSVNYTDVETVNLTADAITLNTTGDAAATISILNGDTSSATVVLSSFTGDGSIGVNVDAETARYSTNLAPAAGPSNVFVVDTHQPTATLSTSSTDQAGDFIVDIAFEEAVADFIADDISIINGELIDFQTVDALNYSATVSAVGETMISINVANSAAHDSAGNGNSASNTLAINFDNLSPSVVISGPTGPVAADFTATIDFSELISGFTEDDIQVVNADLSTFTNVDDKQFTVQVSPINQSDVTLSIADSAATDGLGNGNSLSNSFTVVFDINDAPVISGVAATSVYEDSAYLFTPSYSDADSADTLSFSIVNKPAWASFSLTDGTLSGTPNNDELGVTTGIVISVFDGQLTSSLAPFDIEVLNSNDAPTLSGTPSTSVKEGESYSFTPIATDDDVNDNLEFSIVNKPTWATFSSVDGTLSGTPTNADVGITTGIIITVSDGTVSIPMGAFNITVLNINEAPTISGTPPTSVNEGEHYSFTPTAADEDIGDSLAFNIVNKPTWATFSSVDGTVSGTPTNEDVGVTSAIVISVTDGTDVVSLAAFSIQVVNTNGTPAISGAPALSVLQDQTYSFTPTVIDSDADEVFSFMINNKPLWASFDVATGLLSGIPKNADVGEYSGIVIQVTDSSGESASLSEFAIEVINVNDAPVFTSSPLVEVVAEQAYNYQLTAEDIDVQHDLNFVLMTAPDWLNLSSNGLVTGTAPAEVIGEQFTVVIALTDGDIADPVLQQYTLAVIAPGDTSLNAKAYFTPAPIAPGDVVNLIIKLENTGLAAATSVSFDLEVSDSVNVAELPAVCTELAAGLLSCQLASDIAAGEQSSTVVGLQATDESSGFAIATLEATATNLNGATASTSAQLLIADVLSLVPGEVLSSTPSEYGVTIDINDDSFVDLINFNSATGKLDIRLNDGLGSLVESGSVDTIADVKGIVAGDVNGDGFVDILTVGGADANSIAYLLDGDQFIISALVLDAVQADLILIADLNNDGNVSVILAGIYQSDVAIYSGVGSGNESVELINFFELISQNSPEKAIDKVTSQEDADGTASTSVSQTTSGVTDIVLVETTQGTQLIVSSDNESPLFVQNHEGQWEATAVASLVNSIERLVITDLDSDSKLDSFSYEDGKWTLTLDLFGIAEKSMVSFPDADELLIEDVNSDGVMDILFVTPQGVSIWHYYGINDIRVGAVIAGTNIVGISLLDIDNDGDLDLVTFDSQTGMSLWYLSLDNGFGEQEVELSLFAQAPNFPQLEQSGPVSFMLANQGNTKATGVTLTITPDSGVALSQIPSGCAMSGADLLCNAGAFAIGEQQEITVWATTSAAGTYQLHGQLGSEQVDVNSENNAVTVTLNVPEKTKSSSDGGAMTFVITLWLMMFAIYRRRYFS